MSAYDRNQFAFTLNGVDPCRDWEMLEVLGKGSFGEVRLARSWKDRSQVVAIKRVTMENQQELQFTLRELDLSATLDSPYLVHFYGNYVYENNVYLTMEYCDAGCVQDLINMHKNVGLQEDRILRVSFALFGGLAYLHGRNIVHRDIKPANLLLLSDGSVRISDFGVSRAQDGTAINLQTMVGSPYFLAPEMIWHQQSGEGYGPSVDIWAGGITMLCMAHGRPPYRGMNPMQAMFHIGTKEPPGLDNPEKWSPEFVEAVTMSLQREPTQRPDAPGLLLLPFFQKAPMGTLDKEMMRELMDSYRAQEANGPSSGIGSNSGTNVGGSGVGSSDGDSSGTQSGTRSKSKSNLSSQGPDSLRSSMNAVGGGGASGSHGNVGSNSNSGGGASEWTTIKTSDYGAKLSSAMAPGSAFPQGIARAPSPSTGESDASAVDESGEKKKRKKRRHGEGQPGVNPSGSNGGGPSSSASSSTLSSSLPSSSSSSSMSHPHTAASPRGGSAHSPHASTSSASPSSSTVIHSSGHNDLPASGGGGSAGAVSNLKPGEEKELEQWLDSRKDLMNAFQAQLVGANGYLNVGARQLTNGMSIKELLGIAQETQNALDEAEKRRTAQRKKGPLENILPGGLNGGSNSNSSTPSNNGSTANPSAPSAPGEAPLPSEGRRRSASMAVNPRSGAPPPFKDFSVPTPASMSATFRVSTSAKQTSSTAGSSSSSPPPISTSSPSHSSNPPAVSGLGSSDSIQYSTPRIPSGSLSTSATGGHSHPSSHTSSHGHTHSSSPLSSSGHFSSSSSESDNLRSSRSGHDSQVQDVAALRGGHSSGNVSGNPSLPSSSSSSSKHRKGHTGSIVDPASVNNLSQSMGIPSSTPMISPPSTASERVPRDRASSSKPAGSHLQPKSDKPICGKCKINPSAAVVTLNNGKQAFLCKPCVMKNISTETTGEVNSARRTQSPVAGTAGGVPAPAVPAPVPVLHSPTKATAAPSKQAPVPGQGADHRSSSKPLCYRCQQTKPALKV